MKSNLVSRKSMTPRSSRNALLEMKFSDDSSVFSGLDQENEMKSMNVMQPPRVIRQPKGILRSSSHFVASYDLANGSHESSELFSKSGSSLTESEVSSVRGLRPLVDPECKSANSTISTFSSKRNKILVKDVVDGDATTQITWASEKPKGSVKLISSVTFLGDNENRDENDEDCHCVKDCSSSDSDSRIVDLLNDFERQMDANIQSLSEDDDENDNMLTDFNKNIANHNVDVQSQGPQLGHFLTPEKARNLQRILHKARKEVEVLRDNNEQYKSEIEQMEEEHKSEIKLVEDRAKTKLMELKSMYENEINLLAQEKDDAVVEASRVAARYAENGKKTSIYHEKTS